MKVLTGLLLISALLTDPAKIGKINTLKEEARKAFAAGDFPAAIKKYRFLVDSLNVTEDEVRLNLAHALFQTSDSVAATAGYQSLTGSAHAGIRSKAQQQLGVLANRQGKPEEALQHFKESIKANPANQEARYNYELLKKKLEEEKKKQQQQQDQNQQKDQQQEKDKNQQDKKEQQQKDQQKQEQPKDQQGKDQQQKDNPNEQKQNEQQEQDNPDKKNEEQKPSPSVSEKLEQMNMSEEKAKMILEAMKNQEMQYLQQNKRKPTKPKDKGKPDW